MVWKKKNRFLSSARRCDKWRSTLRRITSLIPYVRRKTEIYHLQSLLHLTRCFSSCRHFSSARIPFHSSSMRIIRDRTVEAAQTRQYRISRQYENTGSRYPVSVVRYAIVFAYFSGVEKFSLVELRAWWNLRICKIITCRRLVSIRTRYESAKIKGRKPVRKIKCFPFCWSIHDVTYP